MVGGVIKIVLSALVFLKGTRNHNFIFFMQGSAIVGDIETTSDKLLGEISNSSKLWHIRVDHISEKTIIRSSKERFVERCSICKLEFCEDYVLGKNTNVKFVKGKSRISPFPKPGSS